MRAIGVNRPGGPEALEVVDLPDPEPAPGELLIRVHAAAVNPTDTVIRSGHRHESWPQPGEPPVVPGMDVAGLLEAVGPDTSTQLAAGDRVMGVVVPEGAHGGYAQRVALPTASVAAAPASASHVEAATLPMNGLTARRALDALDLSPGQTVGVTGAAGAVGGYTIQLAKADGLHVIADAAPADEPLVSGLGADVVVQRGTDVADRIATKATSGVDGLVDAAIQDEQVLPAVADGGGLATLRGFTTDAPRGIMIHPVRVHDYAHRSDKLDELRQQAEDGTISLRVADRFPPEKADEAHRLLEAGGVRGRLVIEV